MNESVDESVTPKICWNADGLAPAIVQDGVSQRILMLGWMNREALDRTAATGRVHFWSRSRRKLWKKGETSGNELRLRSVTLDCDGDALLVRADPVGPTCHTGAVSCFCEPLIAGQRPDPLPATAFGSALTQLIRIVRERAASLPEGSYTAELLRAGTGRIAQKVGEEGLEVALAAVAPAEDQADRVVNESVDLLYHLLVLLESAGIDSDLLAAEARRRFPGDEG